MGAASRRWGGNTTSRYNPDLSSWNTGQDWFFQNLRVRSHHDFLRENKERGLSSAFTVPILGWVAKDSTSYSFPVAIHGGQRKVDPYKKDAGDGVGLDGKPLTPGPPQSTSVQAPPELVAKWISDLRAAREEVAYYILDNEPALWDSTHRDVHPEPVGYDELLDRTLRYGEAVRKADPGARIAGPAEWGWPGYMFSARDAAAGFSRKPDRLAHGDIPLVPWYLHKVREHEKARGTRILDVLDLHMYPQAEGVFSQKNEKNDPETAALRLRQTRGLWDPDYRDESWIKDTVMLLPRMRRWVDENAPGLGLMIGEWNFGGEQHPSGGLAAAEALGKFAEHGVTAAYYWRVPSDGSSVYWAFRAYRNFDDKGAHFQDLLAATAHDTDGRIYASRDEEGRRLVAILLNFSPAATYTGELVLQGCSAAGPATLRVLDYRGGPGGFAPRPPPSSALSAGRLRVEVPPYTITVLDASLGAP